ncbi:hypothetical protein CesoFtcFv8_008880 [Champsocephalus esox]|uniref:Uncharacterized protein n=1 Tax=Champsocephalus esox TaxID=159716 RepID=A0AAN8H4J9_9TELE|nr:hypothetical protein CesoFtcFv8_008880 [Champsocephalus esox]
MRLDQCPGVSWSGTNHPTTDGRCVCVPPPLFEDSSDGFPCAVPPSVREQRARWILALSLQRRISPSEKTRSANALEQT